MAGGERQRSVTRQGHALSVPPLKARDVKLAERDAKLAELVALVAKLTSQIEKLTEPGAELEELAPVAV